MEESWGGGRAGAGGGAGGGGQYNVGVLTDGTITSSRALFSRSQVSPN